MNVVNSVNVMSAPGKREAVRREDMNGPNFIILLGRINIKM